MLRKFSLGFALIALLVGAPAHVALVSADDGTPTVEQATEIPVELPTEVLTDEPTLAPTALPAVSPTEPSTPDSIPTATSTLVPATPTLETNAEMPAVETQTTEPTVLATFTEAPRSISWSRPDPITCTIKSGSSTLGYAASVVYSCSASLDAKITGDLPDDLATIWIVQAKYGAGPISIRLPEGSTAELLPWSDLPIGIDARARIGTRFDPQGVVFEVVIGRTSCSIGDFPVALTVDPQIQPANGVEVTRSDNSDSTPYILNTTFAPIASPSVSFDGPLTFDPLSATSVGLESTTSHGSAVLVIDGDWGPCASWSLSLTGGVESAEIAPQLLVLSVNEEPIPGGVCDLSSPCDLLTLPASSDATSLQIYTVQLALVFDPHTPPGHFNVSVSASVDSPSAQP